LTVAVTLLHIAIAIATIAIIVRDRVSPEGAQAADISAVEKKEWMTAKSVAPSSERNRPEIF
jgi:hypothetical protein